jgi:nucleotide-binding universal stress UspA family protein
MSAYNRILLPTDGSENGVQNALNHALIQAQQFDSVLHILYVTEKEKDVGDTAVYMGEKSPGDKAAIRRVEKQAKQYGVSTKSDIVQGNPAEEIVDYAKSRGIDLIVMGTHERKGISRVLKGSVTEKVIRNSNKPVMAVERED